MPIGRHGAAFIVLSAALSACTSAELGNSADGGSRDAGNPSSDASGDNRADAGGADPPIDAEPPGPDAGLVRLTLSRSQDIVGRTGVNCLDRGVHSYYRVFDLAELGVTGPFDVEKVTFGVEGCSSGEGGLDATVVLSTLAGELRLANLTRLESADTVIPDVAFSAPGALGGRLHEVPIFARAPAGSLLVVEVAHLGLREGQELIMGSNKAGQDGPTFLRAPACDTDEPIETDEIVVGGENVIMHWVVAIDGRPGS